MKLKKIRAGFYQIGSTDWHIRHASSDCGHAWRPSHGWDLVRKVGEDWTAEGRVFDTLVDAKVYFKTEIQGKR